MTFFSPERLRHFNTERGGSFDPKETFIPLAATFFGDVKGISDRISARPLPSDQIQLLIFAKAPASFAMQGKGFHGEEGWVLYVINLFRQSPDAAQPIPDPALPHHSPMTPTTNDTDEVIRIENLTHAYKTHLALGGVSFTVRRKSIHGFVGPNGAGKTTTLKVLATLLPPQRGKVEVFGHNVLTRRHEVRRKIGFMPDHFSMYRQMTVFEYLDFFGAAYGLAQVQRDKIIADVLALTDMEGRKNDLIHGLSRGMQQRVSLARVLVHDPELLLLDEPASGLDPRARIELMEILEELRRLGKTIFISSHILSELATLCDHCTILDRGAVKYSGSMRALTSGNDGDSATYHLILAAAHEGCAAALAALPGMERVSPPLPTEPRYSLFFNRSQLAPNTILQTALASGAEIVGFTEAQRHLNQAFMDLTDPGVRAVANVSASEPIWR
jgi:ABC-2 type transport system ATP-binding protein